MSDEEIKKKIEDILDECEDPWENYFSKSKAVELILEFIKLLEKE